MGENNYAKAEVAVLVPDVSKLHRASLSKQVLEHTLYYSDGEALVDFDENGKVFQVSYCTQTPGLDYNLYSITLGRLTTNGGGGKQK